MKPRARPELARSAGVTQLPELEPTAQGSLLLLTGSDELWAQAAALCPAASYRNSRPELARSVGVMQLSSVYYSQLQNSR